MKLSSTTSLRTLHQIPLVVTLGVLATLAACGGGSDNTSSSSNSNVSQEQAQSASINTAVIPSETSEAMSVALSTAQTVVAGGQANQTYTCPGGGSASYTASGATLAQLTNHQFDAGEQYTLSYTNCSGATGAASVNGTISLTVNSAAGNDFSVSTSTSNVVVTLPLRSVRLNGNSALTHTVTTNGSTSTTTDHWVTPNYTALVTTGSRTNTFSYSNVDLTRSVNRVNGVVSGSSYSGTTTFSANIPFAAFSVTLATVGTANYDATGTPISGTWTLTLPGNALTLSIGSNSVSLSVDYGANGSIDRVYTWTVTQTVSQAG